MAELKGIPAHVVQRTRRFFAGPLGDVLWKGLILLLLALAVLLMAASGVFILVFLAGAILSAILADDIRATLSDIWNRNWGRL